MELRFSGNSIIFDKELNRLDKITINFTGILNRLNIKYVIISGYVAILFGRSRNSEDIDIFIEKLDFKDFKRLWDELNKEFECIITASCESAYKDYLLDNNSIRFSEKGEYLPNVEIKFAKANLDFWSIENRKKVILNGNEMFVSPIELQIPYKFLLGSEKDIEDAYHLYNVFKEFLDLELLKDFSKKLKIDKEVDKYIK